MLCIKIYIHIFSFPNPSGNSGSAHPLHGTHRWEPHGADGSSAPIVLRTQPLPAALCHTGIYWCFPARLRSMALYFPFLLLFWFCTATPCSNPGAGGRDGKRSAALPNHKGNVPFPFEITHRHSGALPDLRGFCFISFYFAGTNKWKCVF